MKSPVFLALLAFLFLAACTSSSKVAGDHEEAILEPPGPQQPTGEDCRALYQERIDLEKNLAAIKCWENSIAESTDDTRIAQFHGDLAYAYYFLARYHLALQNNPDKSAVADTADTAKSNALKALKTLAPPLHEALTLDRSIAELLHTDDQATTNALLNYARALHLWAINTSLATQLANEKTVDEIMTSISESHPGAGSGAADRYLGVRWIERPLHKNPEKSAQHFNQSLRVAPDFLMTTYLRAKYLATATGDRVLFEADLQAILEAKPDEIPENFFAKQLASDLLERADELF